MAEHPEQAKFEPHVGDAFGVAIEGRGDIEMTLVEVTAAGQKTIEDSAAAGRPAPFSILLRGPAEPLLSQAIYRLSHATLGELDLFLVPIGPNGDGIGYEAVFT